jgi:hypothetical protein
MSYRITGFYYPTLMVALLSIFPLSRTTGDAADHPNLATLWTGREPLPTYAFLTGFSILQLVPHMFPGDPAITGQGRLFALHMFDARVVCEAHVTLHGGQGGSRRLRVAARAPTRIRCDPIVYLSVVRALCRQGATHGRWRDLDLSLRSRRTSETALRPVVELDGFCQRSISYNVWRPNPWILR